MPRLPRNLNPRWWARPCRVFDTMQRHPKWHSWGKCIAQKKKSSCSRRCYHICVCFAIIFMGNSRVKRGSLTFFSGQASYVAAQRKAGPTSDTCTAASVAFPSDLLIAQRSIPTGVTKMTLVGSWWIPVDLKRATLGVDGVWRIARNRENIPARLGTLVIVQAEILQNNCNRAHPGSAFSCYGWCLLQVWRRWRWIVVGARFDWLPKIRKSVSPSVRNQWFETTWWIGWFVGEKADWRWCQINIWRFDESDCQVAYVSAALWFQGKSCTIWESCGVRIRQ